MPGSLLSLPFFFVSIAPHICLLPGFEEMVLFAIEAVWGIFLLLLVAALAEDEIAYIMFVVMAVTLCTAAHVVSIRVARVLAKALVKAAVFAWRWSALRSAGINVMADGEPADELLEETTSDQVTIEWVV